MDKALENIKNMMLRVSYISATAKYIEKYGLSEEEKANPFTLTEHVTKYVNDFCDEHAEEYAKFDVDKTLNEIIQHVGYDEEQCGRTK